MADVLLGCPHVSGMRPPELREPRFSIVTATYNAGAALSRTIESVRAQSRRDFEWIVIDGASSDDSIDRIRAAGDVISQWVSEPDEGIADAWNKGLARARGGHVLILNAGDTYDREFLERIGECCEPGRITCAHARLRSDSGKDLGVMRSEPHKLGRGMYVAHNWCAVPRELYRKLGPYAKMPLAMDFEWLHRYYRHCGAAGFRVVDAVLGTYHLGGVSDTHFVRSFQANERVLVDHGTSVLVAKGLTWWLIGKHFLRHRVLR